MRPDCVGEIQQFDRKRDLFSLFKFYDPIKSVLLSWTMDNINFQLENNIMIIINKTLDFNENSVYEEYP